MQHSYLFGLVLDLLRVLEPVLVPMISLLVFYRTSRWLLTVRDTPSRHPKYDDLKIKTGLWIALSLVLIVDWFFIHITLGGMICLAWAVWLLKDANTTPRILHSVGYFAWGGSMVGLLFGAIQIKDASGAPYFWLASLLIGLGSLLWGSRLVYIRFVVPQQNEEAEELREETQR